MALKIHWTIEADNTFEDIVNYISKEWGDQVTSNFIFRVDDVLEKISKRPLIYPATKSKNIRKGYISSHTSLFYRINDEQIELLTFWNNARDNKKLLW